MKTILVTAYAINPYKGSEDGTGWNYVNQISLNNKVIAITRPNNIPFINRYIEENKLSYPNVQFIGFDLPYFMRFWKRGGNGAMLYFYLWQFFMPLFIKIKSLEFDIAHNLNFHTDTIPTFLWMFGKPTIWGPVGHHPKVPKGYYNNENTGFITYWKNHALWILKWCLWNLDPFMYLAKMKVDKIICINKDVEKVLRLPEHKIVRFFSVGSNHIDQIKKKVEGFNILSVGRMVPLKGFDITIKSFDLFYKSLEEKDQNKVKLTLIGKGEQYDYLEKYIEENELKAAVELISWVDQKELFDYYHNSSVFFFPSHEGAGMVVPEAMSHSLPVICFNNCGPGEFVTVSCGVKINYSTYEKSIIELMDVLIALYNNEKRINALSVGALDRFDSHFLWDRKGAILADVYQSVLTPKEEYESVDVSFVK